MSRVALPPAFVALGLAGLLGLAAASAARPAPLLINESHSLARGLYVRTGAAPAAGRIVAFRPPPAAQRYLHTLGAGPNARLLKRVAASGGEHVCAGPTRLVWPRGAVTRLTRDRRGARLPAWVGCRRLAADELLVLGDTPTSFDSRYFGPVRAAAVEGVYREALRW